MRQTRLILAALLALMTAACAELGVGMPGESDDAPAPTSASGATDNGTAPDATPASEAAPDAANAPHIYMALQPDPAGPTSVILAIDRSGDNTPSNDPAVRLTPINGKCNPQQLRWYDFPPDRARRPVYGPVEAGRGVTARDLPEYMAMAVTSQMMTAGLIDAPDESRPQNVCTRKLLQRMIIDRSPGKREQSPPA